MIDVIEEVGCREPRDKATELGHLLVGQASSEHARLFIAARHFPPDACLPVKRLSTTSALTTSDAADE